LRPIAVALQEHVTDCFKGQPRIDRISARAKDVKSFIAKAKKDESGQLKYSEPLSQIQDQVGCRIITFFLADVDRIDRLVTKYFRAIEYQDRIPESEWEFGYFGRHYVLLLPEDVVDERIDPSMIPRFFELQIKTLFQHAWSEAEHDLGYKPGEEPLTSEQKRRLAFTSAQAWGADQMFNELFKERDALGSNPAFVVSG
jgi:ppGpp synthetase/RelA/SpoT-type nucleotidyltranferase